MKALVNYFAEFGVLKKASKEFWLLNAINFFDCLAYFSMITVVTLYLTTSVGLDDVHAGTLVAVFTSAITFIIFFVGFITDSLGVKKSLLIGISLNGLARLGLGVAPTFLSGDMLQYSVWFFLAFLMPLGTAMMAPVVTAGLRKYTTEETRGTGFNMYYLLMNVGAIAAGLLIDEIRNHFDLAIAYNLIFDFGFIMSVVAALCAFLIREKGSEKKEEADAPAEKGERKMPWVIAQEVMKESAFWKLLLFMFITIGVKLVFTHQFLVMPKYYDRVLYTLAPIGKLNAINPTIIVVGLILLIPILNKFDTVKMIIVGTIISSISLLPMAISPHFYTVLPWVNNINDAYWTIIFLQIVVFAIGEVIWSPRIYEYTASIAPEDKVGSYMGLSALPMFIAKPVNGIISGILISKFCFEGVKAKIETGNISYYSSPEFMWLIYFGLAISSPILIVLLKDFITSKKEDEDEVMEEEPSTVTE